MKTSPGTSTLNKNGNTWAGLALVLFAFAICLGWATTPIVAQTAGEAAISGTVTDKTGASIAGASVTAINTDTGVETKRETSSAGVYQISPLIVGTYRISISARGFSTTVQEGIVLHQNEVFGFNPVLNVGDQQITITVNAAPPSINTDNAVLGATIENKEFLELPIIVSGNQQRDVTSFSNYLPGAQSGSRSSLFSGTANRVQEVYLNGIPMTTISQIGDNRPIFNAVPAEAIGEIGVLTSSQSAGYQGAGSVNYTMKTGGSKLHGTVADFVRNTIFDTWGFTAPNATTPKVVNGVVTKVPAPKPVDHQNEFAVGVGGPIVIPHLFDGNDKLFFYAAYDRLHARSAPNYQSGTVPTKKMRKGDFSELLTANGGPGYTIYDPTTLAACTANSTNGPCRYAYGQSAGATKGANGNPTGTITNVIPDSQISPIAQKMQSFLPDPASDGIQGNYIGAPPTGYDNWLYSGRVDYTFSPRQSFAATVTGGNRHAVPYTSSSNMILPAPYIPTTYSTVVGHWADLSHTFTLSPSLVNQFKFGFSYFGGPPLKNVTEGVSEWEAVNMGINFSGVPSNGQAVTEFPTSTFKTGTTSGPTTDWGLGASGVTATTVTESYTGVDNFLWLKGKHAMTFGMQMQWLLENASNYDGPTSSLSLAWNSYETAAVGLPAGKTSGSEYHANSGYPYASYLLGAVNNTSITLQNFSTLGGRYNTLAPYFQDDFKVTSKLTLNLGVRWDYLPSYQEVQDRFSFLNPNIDNPVTGNKGALQFAGSWGGSGVSIGKSTPVNNYLKNWGPRVGLAYALTPKTTIRAGYSLVYSHGGGTGGAANTFNGTGQNGFTSSNSFTAGSAGASAGPAFYLNSANNNYGGPGYTVPAITAPGSVSQTLNVGNTVNGSGAYVSASAAPGYADPYLGGRAPEFSFWNFGIQRELIRDTVLTINYAGSESHFIAGATNMRGKYAGQINPIYYALGTDLNLAATDANLTKANTDAAAAGLPALSLPYTNFGLAAATTAGAGKATIGQMLTWMPQFSGTTDTWGLQGANASYHSGQVSLEHRLAHGLTLNVNYTYAKNLDDAGTQRSGYAIPSSVVLSGKGSKVNHADRSISANSIPNLVAAYGTYKLPFGKGAIGGNNFFVRQVAGGWTLSSMFTFNNGTPLLVINSGCTASGTVGTCMPDVNPSYTKKSIRQNGSWGKGITGVTLGQASDKGGISYAAGYIGNSTNGDGADASGKAAACASSVTAFCNAGAYKIGDSPRSAVYGLRNPSTYNVNMGLSRTFDITPDRLKFIFRVDCSNATNHVTFGGIGVNVSSALFGTVSTATASGASRDFQFSGRFNF